MKRISIGLFNLLFLVSGIFLSSCIKKDFDAPPDGSGYDPQLPITMTIAELQQLQQGLPIEEGDIISGVVVMNDRSGNYYKKIVIQDNTGGIEINIDQSNLYNDYPVGRKVYVKIKGLFLGNYAGNPMLGYVPDANGSVSAIPFVLVNNFIVKASFPVNYKVDTFTVDQLKDLAGTQKYLNTIVAIKEVEFASGSDGVPYAKTANLASATTLTIENCAGETISLRTSGYAKFQPFLTPSGKGTLVGLYTAYNITPQIFIRDTADVRFNDDRCNILPIAAVSIENIRKLYSGTEIILPKYKINGVVISDIENGNVANGSIVLQGSDHDKGIVLYYGGQEVPYLLGDSIEVDISGCTLKSFNGKLEIDGVKIERTIKLGEDRVINPRLVTIQEIIVHPDRYESTLVRLSNVTWSSSSATFYGFSGFLNVDDGTGQLSHYSAATAVFKNLLIPSPSLPVKVTGYVEIHNGDAQIRMRNPGVPTYDIME